VEHRIWIMESSSKSVASFSGPTPSSTEVPKSGVQSVHRVLDVIESIADSGGELAIGEIAAASHLPPATAHRLVRTLVDRGYVRQLSDRRYALGFRFVPLGTTASRMIGSTAGALLDRLVEELGESANIAILSGDRAEYVAQSSSRHAMRLFTEVGRRVELHCSGVGKAMLATLPDAEIEAIVDRSGLTARTPHTLTTLADLQDALAGVRRAGHALDEQEQELGVRCVAVALPTESGSRLAVSVSGPLTRMDDGLVERAVPLLHAAAERLAADLAHRA
jgi:IclR family acetate operon transcriptional repressor